MSEPLRFPESRIKQTLENDHFIVPPEFLNRCRIWHRSAISYQIAGVVIVGIGAICGIAVTYFASHQEPFFVSAAQICGLVSAACVALLGKFSLLTTALKYRHACMVLEKACLDFKYSKEEDRDIKSLVDALAVGELIINTEKDPGAVKNRLFRRNTT